MDQVVLDAIAGTVVHLLDARATLKGRSVRGYDELIALACRKVDEIAPVNISKAAQDRATELGLDALTTYCWFCPAMGRHRDETPKKKRLFLWEHYKPVADIQAEIESLGSTPRIEDVAIQLRQTKIVWVLRAEGLALGDKSRPDPAATYRAAGVELAHAWEDCATIDCKRHRAR